MEEIEFLLDETKLKNEERLKEILNIIKINPKIETNAYVLTKFVRAAMLSQIQKKPKKLIQQSIIQQKRVLSKIPRPLPPPPHPKIKPSYYSIKREYPLIVSEEHKQLATALLTHDPITNKIKYFIKEPEINNELLREIEREKPKNLIKTAKKLTKKYNLEFNQDLLSKVQYYINRDLKCYNKVEPLMHDGNITRIICNGVNKPVLINYKDIDLNIETNIIFTNNIELNNFVKLLGEKSKTKLTEKNPILDTHLGDIRIEATLGNEVVSSKFIIIK